MKNRNLYLNNMPLEEAKTRYDRRLSDILQPRCERISIEQALHRVTSGPVYARYSSPSFNAAAMDGIAVIAGKTVGARETTPVQLRYGADYLPIDTGDPVRPPYDAVIMAEDLLECGEEHVEITAAAAPWQHVRPVGEDIVAGEMVLPSYHRVRPVDMGVLLAAGILEMDVLSRPRVAIIPTGTEIIEPCEALTEGAIIDANSGMFAGLVEECGGVPVRYAPVPDVYAYIRDTVLEAVAQNDVVLVNAGSSAGTEDYTVHVLRELGEVIVHGVAVKPGKPVILAMVEGKPVIGLPGYPVAAYISFINFVAPLLEPLTGMQTEEYPSIEAVLSRRLVSSLKHTEYVRVKVGKVTDKQVAAPLARGSGAAMSLVRADGFCVIPQNREGIEAGEKVTVKLCRPLTDLENTLMLVGSHDMLLDVIEDIMSGRQSRFRLSSTHVGSLGGLLALKRGECHMAPIHLLDEASGTYNIRALQDILEHSAMLLVKGVGRLQGLMVKPGNPQGIRGVNDLSRCRYVNRQRGAGTRLLLDYRLKEAGITPESIRGYEREATTHMAVAALVAGDSADAGMGVYSAAKAMKLDFVEVGWEEYDFALPCSYLNLPQVEAFLETLKSPQFHQKLQLLGGYCWDRAGEIMEL